jgi:mRNA-degrading endonuclease RelE of RelBE toxin-antitoxin system
MTMKVSQQQSVTAAIRTLDDEDRRRVFAWLRHLENWENDAHVRKLSKPTRDEGIYALTTTDDLRIFFKLDLSAKEITVLDIAKPSRFENVPVASE